jgi:hypothetical protein
VIWRHQDGKFRHGGTGLAATGQLGSAAQLPSGPGAGAHEGARAGRDASHVRRERPLRDEHAYARLEQAEAGTPLCVAVRRRSAGAVRAGRSRRAHRASLAMDPQGEYPLVVCMDQRRGRRGVAAAGHQIHQCHREGNEEERRRRHEARRRLRRYQHHPRLQGCQDRLGRRHDADDGGPSGQERR